MTRFISTEIDEVWFADSPALFSSELCYGEGSRKSNHKIITELTSAGTPMNQKDSGKTPLHWALKSKGFPVFKFLVLIGATIPKKMDENI